MKILHETSHENLLFAGVSIGLIPTAISWTVNLNSRYSVLGLVLGMAITLVLLVVFLLLL
jgi:hypothetical protein